MAIQRAAVLYPVNGTTVDNTGGADIRLLNNAAAANDTSQTVTATHTQDNVARTFDPASAGVTTATAPDTLQNLGWALRLSEDMTPSDNVNCDATLTPGTLTVNIEMTLTAAGGNLNLGGTATATIMAALFKYNPSSDSGSFIASGTASQGWNTAALGGDAGDYKTTAVPVTIGSSVNFSDDEIILLQIGMSSVGTLANPGLGGTTTYTWTLRLGASTNITFAAGQGIRQVCSLDLPTTGHGEVTRSPSAISTSRSATGNGESTYTKAATLSKTFDLAGYCAPTYSKYLTAYRTFSLEGQGTIPTQGPNSSTITIPIDEVPTGEGGGETVVTNYFFPVLD